MITDGITNQVVVQEQTASAVSQEKLDENFNRFMTLLVTQLKNQDPLDPLDANDFTSQLVQFSSVEQQIRQNTNLEKLISLQESALGATMVDFLGTTIEAASNEVPLVDGNAEITYTLENVAANVTISIKSAAGLTVFTSDGETEFGKHTFIWNGQDSSGFDQPDGTYTVTISALDRNGELLDVTQTVVGRVTGAGVVDGTVNLFLNDTSVPIFDVISVRETKIQTE